jgi:hypothetical protein
MKRLPLFEDYTNESLADYELKKEYVIWGIPPGKDEEEVLFTKAETMDQAEKAMKILIDNHGCTECRIQVIDFESDPDFIGAIN